MEEEKLENEDVLSKIKEESEKVLSLVLENGINAENVDMLGKLVDIHKDIANENYWKEKEANFMKYRMYGNEDYSEESYGRRGVPGTGRRRYRGEDSYGRRGVPGSGRGRYRGEEMLDEMAYHYGNYSDGKEMYGADQDTLQSYKMMLKAFKEYFNFLKENASTQEEEQMLEHAAREMSQM